MTGKAVFLDRDGVIVRAPVRDGKPCSPPGPDDLEILPGVVDALARLREAGFRLIVVTNQPDVARGTRSREAVEAENAILLARLPIDEIRVCYHDDADGCPCRKPAPGMLLDAAREHHLDLAECYMVGDRWRDVEAGLRAGCRTIFLDYGYRERRPESFHFRCGDLSTATGWIVNRRGMP